MPMQIFNAAIQLRNMDGQTITEVNRRGLTVPEIHVLRRVHGIDAVVRIKHVGHAEIDPSDERERLDYEYSSGLQNLHEDSKTSVTKMFTDFGPLPETLQGYEGELIDTDGELEDFQRSEPFASPNAEDKGSQIRKKAAARREKATKLDDVAAVTKTKKVTGKMSLDSVL